MSEHFLASLHNLLFPLGILILGYSIFINQKRMNQLNSKIVNDKSSKELDELKNKVNELNKFLEKQASQFNEKMNELNENFKISSQQIQNTNNNTLTANKQLQTESIHNLKIDTALTDKDLVKNEIIENLESPLLNIEISNLENKNTETKNTEFEELKNLISILNDVILEVDEKGSLLKVWSTNDEIIFVPKDEILGRYIHEFFPATFARMSNDAIKYIIQNPGKNKTIEYPSINKDKRWLSCNFSEIKRHEDIATNKRKICIVISDITERKKIENELSENHELFKSLSDNVPVGVWMSDIDGNFNFFNKTWLDFTGRSVADDSGEGWFVNIHPDYQAVVQRKYLKSFHERLSFSVSYPFKNKNGEYHWFKNEGLPRFNNRGDFIGFIGSCFDITEELKLQQEIKSNQKFLSEMASVAKIGGWELSPITRRFTFTDEVYAILEINNQIYIDIDSFILFFKENIHEDLKAKFKLAFEKNKSFELEAELKNKQKVVKIVARIDGTNLNQKRIFGVLQDITLQLEAQKQMDQQKAVALQSSKMAALGEMAGNISHEINNPLAIIQGSAEQLKRFTNLNIISDPNVVKVVTRIVNTTHRISKIIKGLRSFSQNADKDPFQATLVTEIIDETLALCESRLGHQGIELQFTSFDPLIKIDCRSIQIEQVLLNLINNSTDAIALLPEKWIKIECLSINDNEIDIKLTDSGGGIPIEVINRLMEPFFTTKEEGKGTGLGLYVSRMILQSHNGDLYYDHDSPNTCFALRLPIKQNLIQIKTSTAS